MDHCLKILIQTWLLIANENINYGKLNMYGNKLWRILLKSDLIEILSIQSGSHNPKITKKFTFYPQN